MTLMHVHSVLPASCKSDRAALQGALRSEVPVHGLREGHALPQRGAETAAVQARANVFECLRGGLQQFAAWRRQARPAPARARRTRGT